MEPRARPRQPVQIGVHAAVVLVALLLVVPLQLLFSRYVTQSLVEEEEEALDIQGIRADAVTRLGDAAQGLLDRFSYTLDYYSSWGHLKELVLVPYKKRDKSNIHLKSTVVKSDGGTTTILLTKDNKRKGTKPEGRKTKQLKVSREPQVQSGKGVHVTVQKSFPPDSEEAPPQKAASPKEKPVVDEGTSPAKEVEDYLYREFYFTQSKAPRDSKPSSVKYSIGQVVKHTTEGFYGVVIGWDPVAKAPESWVETYYSDRKYVTKTPHYLVLVDSHFDASGAPYHYIPQEDLELIHTNIHVRCPEMSKYFDGYKNGRHTPKPWLKARYPKG